MSSEVRSRTGPSPASWPQVRFAPRRLGHFNLWVGNLEESHHFYRDVCGLELVFDEPGVEARFYSNGNSHHDLALMQASEREFSGRDGHRQVAASRGRFPGLNHLAFEMASEADLVAAIERSRETGFDVERTVDHQISRSVYIADPDSFTLELYADAAGSFLERYQKLEGQLLTELWDPFSTAPSASENYESEPVQLSVDGALLTPLRAAHATLVVSDLARSIDFYTSVVGLELVRGGAGEPGAVLAGRLGLPDLLLLPARREPAHLHHITFELSDDPVAVEAALSAMRHAGVAMVRTIESEARRGFVVRDPDGVLVEFATSVTVGPKQGDSISEDDWTFLV